MSRFERGLAGNDPSQFGPVTESVEGVAPVLVRYSKSQRRALKQLALDEDTSMETLMHEALDLLLKHYGRDVPPSSRVEQT
jgi:hypothetical protein